MANFCTNCGTRLGKDDNFCTNCGTKVVNFDIKQNNPSSISMQDSIEKKKAKQELKRVVGGRVSHNKTFTNTLRYNGLGANAGNAIRQHVEKEIESGQIKSAGVEFRVNQLIVEYKARMEKEKEEEKKKLKMIDEIFESDEIKSQISENKNTSAQVSSTRDSLKDKLINKKENMGEVEIKNFIKSELKARKEEEKDRIAIESARISKEKARREEENAKIAKEKEIRRKIERNEISGGYCNYSCKYYIEEYISSDGDLDFDFDSGDIVDHYCALGHSLLYGSFCKYYKK